jgi:HlyD family secretion protein
MVNDARADARASASTSSPLSKRLTILAALLAVTVGGATVYSLWCFQDSSSTAASPAVDSLPEIKTVTALGRLEPSGEVISLSAPVSAEGSRVEQLLVKEGDRIQKGQVIAILDSRDRLQAALEQAQEQVRIAEANLARVRAGAKAGAIEAQQSTISRIRAEEAGDLEAQAATVARLNAELRNARLEDERYAELYREGAISESLQDSKRLALDTATQKLREAEATLNRTRLARQQQLQEAEATLDQIAEVRPVDIQVAEGEVGNALAAVKRAQANLDQAFVRAPQDGQILKIHSRPGELVANEGIAEIGQTSQMYAIAEVYESDVNQIRPGQPVTITSDSIPDTLHGTVDRIGLRVQKQQVINTDPSANIDARIIEVKVRLDRASSQKVSSFTNLQVKVVVETL